MELNRGKLFSVADKLEGSKSIRERLLANQIYKLFYDLGNESQTLSQYEIELRTNHIQEELYNSYLRRIDEPSASLLEKSWKRAIYMCKQVWEGSRRTWYVNEAGIKKIIRVPETEEHEGYRKVDFTIPRTENGYEITPELECSLSDLQLAEAKMFLGNHNIILELINEDFSYRDNIINGNHGYRGENVDSSLVREIEDLIELPEARFAKKETGFYK